MKIMVDMPDYKYKCLQKRIELGVASEMDVLVAKGKAIEQESKTEPCEDMERKIEKEYLFESLCEDLKKMQAENENLRNVLEQESCKDCISREYMYKLGAKCIAARNENDVLVAIASIESLPSVQPKPKAGHWIKSLDSYGNNHFTCPFCGHDIATKSGTWEDNYCSNCGAKMESESEYEQKTSQESI